MVRVDMGERDRLDGAASLGRDRERPVERRTGRVARVDQHEPAAPDEVGADRLPGHAATGRHDDAGHLGRQLVDLDRAERPRREPLADLVDRPDVLELLEGGAGRQPHGEAPVGHRVQGVGRSVSQAWAATSSPSNDGSTPSGSAAAKNRASNRRGRVGGVTQRDSGTSRSVRSRRSRSDARSASVALAAEQRGPAALRLAAADAAAVGKQDPGLLEQLADRGEMRGQRDGRREVAAERRCGLVRRQHGPRHERRIGVGRVHPTAREDVHVARERHRRRPPGQQDLEPGRPRPEQHDRRRRPRLDRGPSVKRAPRR